MVNTKEPLHIVVRKEQYPRRKLNALYRDIPLSEDQIKLLRKYFDAFANLYGIIPLRVAFDIILNQAPGLITEEQFIAFAEIARHECDEYRILGVEDVFRDAAPTPVMDLEIIDIALLETGFADYFGLHQKQFGSPYHIPEQKILLRYSDPFYIEPNPAYRKIRALFQKMLPDSGDRLNVLYSEIIYGARYMDADIVDVMERLEYHQIVFTSDEDAQQFAALYVDFYSTVRAQWRRGYQFYPQLEEKPFQDPYSLCPAFGPIVRRAIAEEYVSSYDYQKDLIAMDIPNEDIRYRLLKELHGISTDTFIGSDTPISRNSPCPCGSGKRYKHCCGKGK